MGQHCPGRSQLNETMKLPENSAPIIKAFTGLSEERKAEICSHLAQTPDASGQATIKTMLENGGPEAEFVSKVFDLPLPSKIDAPKNKAATPLQHK